MICPPCKDAGERLRDGITNLAVVAEQHGYCEDPVTCPCKHEILPIDAVVSGRKDG